MTGSFAPNRFTSTYNYNPGNVTRSVYDVYVNDYGSSHHHPRYSNYVQHGNYKVDNSYKVDNRPQ